MNGLEYWFKEKCSQLADLEERAGISSGRDLIDGRDLWRDVRELYFGVVDFELRKELISKHRDCVDGYHSILNGRIAVAKGTVKFLQDRGNVSVWLGSGVVATICVFVGAFYFEVFGAIAGAVLGSFVGLAVRDAWLANRAGEIKRAKEHLRKEMQYAKDEALVHRQSFGFLEEKYGTRDESWDC